MASPGGQFQHSSGREETLLTLLRRNTHILTLVFPAIVAALGTPAIAAVPVGEWQGDWFVDEQFDQVGEIGQAPYETETFTLFIEEFDAATGGFGTLVFDNQSFFATEGLIRDLQFDGTNLTANVDYTPFLNEFLLPLWPTGPDGYVRIEAVVTGDTMAGLLDEPAPNPGLVPGSLTFRGDFSAILVPEPSALSLQLAALGSLLTLARTRKRGRDGRRSAAAWPTG
jgi:hypothetical protein